jgi:hypothetical protein
VLVIATFTKGVSKEASSQLYRDAKLSARLPAMANSKLVRDVHRVPRSKLQAQGRIGGKARSVYAKLASLLKESQASGIRDELRHLAGIE